MGKDSFETRHEERIKKKEKIREKKAEKNRDTLKRSYLLLPLKSP